MYQPEQDITDLVSGFIQSPQDPHLQQQIANYCATGPEQAAWLERRLTAWLNQEIPDNRTSAPAIAVRPVVQPRVAPWKWLTAAAAVLLVVVLFFAGRRSRLVEKMVLYSNNTGHNDTLQLDGGSRLIAARQAVISYAAGFSETPDIRVISGDACLEIDRSSEVHVQLDDHTVLDASRMICNVRKTGEVSKVFVAKGHATLRRRDDPPMQLASGTEAIKEPHRSWERRQLKSAAPLAWLTGQLRFRNIPLEEVLEAVNGYYGLEIMVPPSAVALYKRRITADFGRKSEEEVIALLRNMLNVPVVKDSARRYYMTMK
jgi:ferric-dicitrate binding protein FerR (iron transport regulator)